MIPNEADNHLKAGLIRVDDIDGQPQYLGSDSEWKKFEELENLKLKEIIL